VTKKILVLFFNKCVSYLMCRSFPVVAAMDNVAASISKKRIWEEPESLDPPASSDGSTGGDDASLDLINRLSDDILGTIISLLPIKGAAQTTLISSRLSRQLFGVLVSVFHTKIMK
jgi:hypothetical protein